MYLNKAIIFGNLTRDPELKSLPSGSTVVNFSVATNRVWKDKAGAKQENVEFHNVVAFGRTAETIHQYMKKGSGIFIEGRLQTRSWDGTDGKKNYRTEIVADSVQFGPRSSAGGAQTPAVDTNYATPTASDPMPTDTIDYPEDNVNVDDIPF